MNYSKYDLTKFDYGFFQGNNKERITNFDVSFFASVGVGRSILRDSKFNESMQASVPLYAMKRRAETKLSGKVEAFIDLRLNTIRELALDSTFGAQVSLSKIYSVLIPFEGEIKSSVLVSKTIGRSAGVADSIVSLVKLSKLMSKLVQVNGIVNAYVEARSFREVHMIVNVTMLPGDELIIDSDMANIVLNGESVVDKYDGDEFIYLTNRIDVLQITPLGGGTLDGIIVYNEGWL